MRKLARLSSLGALVTGLAVLAPAQTTTTPIYLIRVQQGGAIQTVTDGSTISYAADAIGASSDATVSVTFLGTGTLASTMQRIDLTGSSDFTIPDLPTLPLSLTATQNSFTFTARYTPSTSNRVTGKIAFVYLDTANKAGSISLNLVGVAPEFAFTYILPPAGNTALLNDSDTVTLPQAAINDTSTAVIAVTNKGTGPGIVRNVALTGDPSFILAGLPFLPATVQGGADMRFTVRFTPKQLDPVAGAVKIDLFNRSLSFKLQGSGLGPMFTYEQVRPGGSGPLPPGGTLTLPDVNVGITSSISVRVRNAGNADARIPAITIQGAGFTLTDLPTGPLVLPAGATASFTVNFTPTQPGRVTGKLRVGDDIFDVAGTGLGSTLVISYLAGGTPVQIQNNATVVFTPAAVGESSELTFSLRNDGNAPTTINSVSVNADKIFAITQAPVLPVTVQPGADARFTVTFTPAALGPVTNTLRIDSQTFTLNGSGNPPAALPDYRFNGSSGAQEPAQQPAVGLSIARAYPLTLNGTLTLAFTSDVFSNDPSVQFASGGRTVNFQIPAGTTDAVFPNNQKQMRLQTGTVAGTISLTPSFATEGGISLTPTNPPALNLTVAPSAPRLSSVQLSSKTSSVITLLVTGYATGRSITQIDLTFTPVSGETVGTSKLTLPVEPSFTAWYQGAASVAFGSQFTATITLNFAGDVKNVTTPADTISAISVTLTNRQGTSPAVSVNTR